MSESLLQLLQQRALKAAKYEKAHRILIAGRHDTTVSDVGRTIQKLLAKHEINGEDDTQFTGLLLQLPLCVLLLLEGHQDCMIAFLRELHSLPSTETGMGKIKLLSSMQDIPQRMYPLWDFRIIQPNKMAGEPAIPDKEQLNTVIPEMVLQLERMGMKLLELPPDEHRSALDALRTKFAEFVPRVEDITGLVDSEETCSLQEYLDLFYTPIELTLDSELVWPAPPPLTY